MAEQVAQPQGQVQEPESGAGFSQRMLDGIERVGNKVPHPVLMFLYLIVIVVLLSQVLEWLDVSATETIAVPVPVEVSESYYEDTTQTQLAVDPTVEELEDPDFELVESVIPINGMLDVEGIRFIFTSFVTNFQNFGVVGVTFIAMLGAGAA